MTADIFVAIWFSVSIFVVLGLTVAYKRYWYKYGNDLG